MITVALNETNFEYDIHSLVKAFYPEQEVTVRAFPCGENPVPSAGESDRINREETNLKATGEQAPAEGVSAAVKAREKKLADRRRWKTEEFWKSACHAKLHLEVEYRENAIVFSVFEPFRLERPADFRETTSKRAALPDTLDASKRAALPDAPDAEGQGFFLVENAVLTGKVSVDPSDRRETKNRLKQKLYEMLAEYSGRTLPWGTLTGIRPTKIPMAMLEGGETESAIRAYMKDTYFASDAKIDLGIEVAKREMELLSRIDYENGYSLYIGIPFCPSTCLYCSFTSYPINAWTTRVDEYLDALCREISATAELMKEKHLNSVYIGGGTPTSLEPGQLERLITAIGESFHLFDERGHVVYGGHSREQTLYAKVQGRHLDVQPDQTIGSDSENHLLEFTVEAGRPDSITAEKLEVLRRHNISRISINPQTMKEETLRIIGRRHTVEQTVQSFALARDMGFDNINMDLIVGLPEETLEDVRRTMEAVAGLQPDNVTVHSLAVKRAARLKMEREKYEHLHMENTWEIIDLTAEYCRKMGLSPYYLYRQKNMAGNFENVGYAAPGKAGVYNILIMEEKQTILALGAGATTKVVYDHGNRIERVGNVKDINVYLERVDEMIERKRKLLRGHTDEITDIAETVRSK
ncbi:MAG: coproporphyrinogen dehydrogenase HemZ [Clostridiales bacterium]|nr:coproporphyrinogen dehydrogenase HemZ [Clostridiales bacterium]